MKGNGKDEGLGKRGDKREDKVGGGKEDEGKMGGEDEGVGEGGRGGDRGAKMRG